MFNPRVQMVARILLGVILVVFGVNKLVTFLPNPELSAEAGSFFGAIVSTGYLFQFIGIVEILAGVALLANKYVNVGLLIFAPVAVNILLFHLFLDPATVLGPGLLVFLLTLYLLLANKSSFNDVLRA